MKRTILTSLSLLAAATLGFNPMPAIAAEKAAAAEKKAEKAEIKDATGKTPAAASEAATKEGSKESKESAGKPFPYTGKVSKIDAGGKSITLAGTKKERVIVIDDATKVTKDGKAATLADLKVGEEVSGQVTKSGEEQIAKSVKIGGKEGKAGAPDPTAGGTTEPVAKPGTAPIKGGAAGSGALSPATAETKSGAGAPNSSSAGPGVKGVPQSGGQAPAGSKKN